MRRTCESARTAAWGRGGRGRAAVLVHAATVLAATVLAAANLGCWVLRCGVAVPVAARCVCLTAVPTHRSSLTKKEREKLKQQQEDEGMLDIMFNLASIQLRFGRREVAMLFAVDNVLKAMQRAMGVPDEPFLGYDHHGLGLEQYQHLLPAP